MVSSWVILPLLLLCAIGQTKTFPSEHPTEAPSHSVQIEEPDSPAKNASGHEVPTVGSGNEPNTKNASGQEVHSVGPGMVHEQNATTGQIHAEQNRTTGYFNPRGKPQFRRYYDLMNGTPVISKRVNDQWVRLHPAVKDREEEYETNITRFIRFENGSRIARRSMYDYSYDGVSWFRLSRIRVPIAQTQNGTIFKYRYGPKRWVDPFFRNRYMFNSTNMTFEDVGPSGQAAHSVMSPQNNYRNYRFNPNLEHSYGRLNYRRRSYRYGSPFDPRTRRYFYGDRDRFYRYPYRYDYPRRDRLNNYGYYDPYRNTYNDPRFAQNNPQYYYADGRWVQSQQRDANEYYDRRYVTQQPYDARRQTYDARRYGYDNTYNDGRHGSYGTHNTYYDRKRYDGNYDDGRYGSYGTLDGYNSFARRYPNDGTHDDGRYRNDGTHDDGRYRNDGTHDDRRYRS